MLTIVVIGDVMCNAYMYYVWVISTEPGTHLIFDMVEAERCRGASGRIFPDVKGGLISASCSVCDELPELH